MAEQSFHVRSISLPSTPHPTTLKIKEELQNIRTCQTSTSSSPSTSTSSTKQICRKLRSLEGLYNGIQNLLHLPSIHQGLMNSSQRKWLEEEVDISLVMLDLCGTMKDAVIALKEHIQDLQSALRRKTNNTTKETVQVYHHLIKEVQKIMKKSHKGLKKLQSKTPSLPLNHEDSDLSEAIKEFHEAREVTISVLLSVSTLSITNTKSSKWSFPSKTMQKKRIACEENLIEIQSFDALACDEKSAITQDQLEGIKMSVAGLESGLESLYRALIQQRVSILNILSL